MNAELRRASSAKKKKKKGNMPWHIVAKECTEKKLYAE